MGQKRKITDLVIDEVSLVDKGANQHAVVTIAKNAGDEKENEMEIFDEQGNPLDADALNEGDTVYDAEGNAYVMEYDDNETTSELQEEVEPVGKSAGYNPFTRERDNNDYASEIREELSKALTDKDRDDIVSKALGQVGQLSREVEIAKRAAEQERMLRLEREYTEVAKNYNLPVDERELGGVLMRCAESLSDEDCALIAKCLDVASTVIYEEYGSMGGGDNADIMQQLEAAVDSTVSKASGVTREEALVELMSQNPELYDDYRAGN